MDAAALAFLDDEAAGGHFFQGRFDGVAIGSGGLDDAGHGDGRGFGEEVRDFYSKIGEVGEHGFLGLDFGLQALLLADETAKEEDEPGFPIGPGGGEAELGLAEGGVVGGFVFLDDAFEAGIGDIGITEAQEEEGGEHAGEAAVAILKRMDGKEPDGEDGDAQERVESLVAGSLVEPAHELFHLEWSGEGRGGGEDDADLAADGIESGHVVRGFLVVAPVAFIFGGVLEKDAMKLADVIFGNGDGVPRGKDEIHDGGVTGDFLFVAVAEGIGLDVGEQGGDLLIGELGTLDAGG